MGALVSVPAALAWEFNLDGSYTWKYEYLSQQGRQGFFGPYDVDNSVTAGTNNLNLWTGLPRAGDRELAPGCDAAISYMSADLWPQIRITEALQLQGKYRLGRWLRQRASYHVTETAQGVDTAFTEGQWTMFWADAETPWGRVTFGKRPKIFGTGLQYDGSTNLSSEALRLVSPLGPFLIAIEFYPYRQTPADNLGAVFIPENESFFRLNEADKNRIREKDLEASVIYNNGPLQMGVLAGFFSYHFGPESVIGLPLLSNGGLAGIIFYRDTQVCHGSGYLKYFNGRFFLNAEAAWLYETTRYTRFASDYVNQWTQMVEGGFLSGPAKLSLMYMRSPGLDRRGGAHIDRQDSAFLRSPELARQYSSSLVLQPYARIMSYLYGSGIIGSFAPFPDDLARSISLQVANLSDNTAPIFDAQFLSGRFDYAVASNLNFFLSFAWAERVSKGWPWGFIYPRPGFVDSNNVQHFPDGNVITNPTLHSYTPVRPNPVSPNIPASAVGYEIDMGVDWKLLEYYTLSLLVGRWQPGQWFSYACVDRRWPAWDTAANSSNSFATVPNKPIDPIWAINVSLSADF